MKTIKEWEEFFDRNCEWYYDFTGDGINAISKEDFINAIKVISESESVGDDVVGYKTGVYRSYKDAFNGGASSRQPEIDGLKKRVEELEAASTKIYSVTNPNHRCDTCGCFPSVIICTKHGRFCDDHVKY